MRIHHFLLIVFIVSCTPESNFKSIKYLDPHFVNESFDDWIQLEQSFFLEIPDSIVVGVIKQIEFTDSLIYLLEDGITSSILVFDREGDFKRQLLKLGSGPGEYVQIDLFVFDKNHISIYDRTQMKLIKYSLKDFSVFQAFDIEDYLVGALSVPNTSSLFFVSDTDVETGIQKGYGFSKEDFTNLKFKPQFSGFIEGFLPQSISHFGENYFLVQPFSDKVYQIGKDSIYLVDRIDFGSKRIPEKVSTFDRAEDLYEILSSDSYFFAPTNLLVRDSIISFNFFNETIDNLNFGLIQNGKAYRFSIDSNLKEFFLKPITVREDLLHTVLLPGEYNEEIIELLNLTKDDNEKPILVSYTIGQ
ncbi:6-bladed beta-propeller [Algoriphagus ornithinivorans]|nr:6-bladed beta-propeller [Algoriphagus ornithinivorans]